MATSEHNSDNQPDNQQAAHEAAFNASAPQRFQNNMLAFSQYFPDIYETFKQYQPSAKFHLRLNPNGTPNMTNHDTGAPMYEADPVAQANRQVQMALANPDINREDFSYAADADNPAEFLHLDLVKAIGGHYIDAKQNLELNVPIDKHIPSKVIFGIGLGYHLMPLRDATIASYISIFEPNNDYFYASLFCFDWQSYLQKIDADGSYLFIGIGDSDNEIYQALLDRTKQIGAFSILGGFFYSHYASANVDSIITAIKQKYHQFAMGFGFFDDALMGVSHTVGVLEKSPAMFKYQSNMRQTVTQYPVFIIASGPSLDNDIEKVKSLASQAIIVACNSATTALLSYGIVPDFHVALERTGSTADFVKAHISDADRQKINLLVLNVMYPDVLDLFGWSGIALKGSESGTSLYQLAEVMLGNTTATIGYCNPLVGNTALSFFTHLGFENIYLFGVDSGYKSKEHHHTKSSFYYDKAGETVYNQFTAGKDFEVEGNFGEPVFTEPFLHLGKQQMEQLLHFFAGDKLSVYNCSDGIKIEGTQPLHSEDLLIDNQPQDKQAIIEELKQTGFAPVNEAVDLSAWLDFDTFDEICTTMADMLAGEISCRSDGLKKLMAQLQYFNSLRDNRRYQHLYLLLQGECLYISSILISLLYRYGDEKAIVPYFSGALALWRDFLIKAPTYYRERWNQDSISSFDFDKRESRLRKPG